MKSFFYFALLVCSLVFLSSCTLIKYFIVVNSSDEDIEIQYETKKPSDLPLEVTTESNLDALGFFQKAWDRLPIEQYNLSEDKRIVKVRLKPHQAVKIGSGDPYYLNKGDDSYFDLKTLEIKGKNKEIYFENSLKLLNEFRKKDYQITYK